MPLSFLSYIKNTRNSDESLITHTKPKWITANNMLKNKSKLIASVKATGGLKNICLYYGTEGTNERYMRTFLLR